MLLTLLTPQGAPGSVVANLTATLDAVALTSDATLVSPPISADLAVTLGAVTLSADGTVTIQPITADLAVTLGDLLLSSGATVSGAAVAGYGVGGPFVSEAYPITGVAGVPPPVVAVVRQTH